MGIGNSTWAAKFLLVWWLVAAGKREMVVFARTGTNAEAQDRQNGWQRGDGVFLK
jgi:hypothetical protein